MPTTTSPLTTPRSGFVQLLLHSSSVLFVCDNLLYHTLDPGRGPVEKRHRMTTEIILAPSPDLQPAPFFTPTPKAAKRVLEFFTGQINNDHTRRAYMNATRRFAAWCASKTIDELAAVQPFHVAAFIKDLQAEVSPPTVKQHLAAIRMLFDWLVTGHVIDVNPAHAVRGPKYVVKKGKTPVLTADEARTLLDSISITKRTAENGVTVEIPDLMGLRDRALIGLMAYSFARVGAVLQMKVGDYFVQGRRRWVRLHEKGGKEHDVPCHHNLDHFLDEYLAAAGIAGDATVICFERQYAAQASSRKNPCTSKTPIA
jgi:site-specific recombinase XerD